MLEPVWSTAGQGSAVIAFGRNLIRITSEETGGRFGMMEVVLGPGEGTPVHVHEREDEFFHVLSGRFAFWCAGVREDLSEGGAAFLPKGVPHRLENLGPGDGRLLVVLTPGGFEGFFQAVAHAAPEEVPGIAGRFGLSFPDP